MRLRSHAKAASKPKAASKAQEERLDAYAANIRAQHAVDLEQPFVDDETAAFSRACLLTIYWIHLLDSKDQLAEKAPLYYQTAIAERRRLLAEYTGGTDYVKLQDEYTARIEAVEKAANPRAKAIAYGEWREYCKSAIKTGGIPFELVHCPVCLRLLDKDPSLAAFCAQYDKHPRLIENLAHLNCTNKVHDEKYLSASPFEPAHRHDTCHLHNPERGGSEGRLKAFLKEVGIDA